MSPALVRQALPAAAPARVLACGAWLKNTACLLDGDTVWMSPLHGDLGTPEARTALLESMARLQQHASGPVEAVAHDLHPDFFSTEVAQQLAQHLNVPAIAVQHHHAHIAQVQAQHAPGQVLLGWALDGVGWGADQTAWGGELLRVQNERMERVKHLPALMLPGGDVAAREPWRMAVAALHRLGGLAPVTQGLNADARAGTQTADGAPPLFGSLAHAQLRAGPQTALPPASLQGVRNLLQRGLNCRPTTSAGRWFDAVAALLGVCWWQAEEAQAAIALEQLAAQWLDCNPAPPLDADLRAAGLNLDVLLHRLLARMAGVQSDPAAYRAMQCQAAALFHVALADALARAAIECAQQQHISAIALSGGCFFNRILRTRLCDALTQAGLAVHVPHNHVFGDAGLAVGQAWVAAHTLHAAHTPASGIASFETHSRSTLCV